VQACAYCELLEPILGARPGHFSLYLGGQHFQRYATADVLSWYERLRQRYRTFRAGFDPSVEPEDAPGDHGLWDAFIQQRLERKRDLILVAGMRTGQRDRLCAAGIRTIDQLATWPEDRPVKGLDPAVLLRLRDQARIQLAGERSPHGAPAFEVRPVAQQGRGLAMLPAPDHGDIWFDMEGFPDPIHGAKLQYLFGACHRDPDGELHFANWWAHDPGEEKQAFDGFVRWVEARRTEHPNLHIYHYASYEKTALGNLASRHAIHQDLIDQWLRDELLVDLYPIVRHGLLIGATSYSIKKVERLYGGAREQEVENAADSVVRYAQWRKTQSPGILEDLRRYNETDCQVTEGLHRFLCNLPAMRQIPFRANRWGTAEREQAEEQQSTVHIKALEAAARELLQELPDSPHDPEAIGPRGISWRLQTLIGQLIDFHEREGMVEWWEFFHRVQMTPEEKEGDSEVIAAARLEGEETIDRSIGFRYRFDAGQPLKLAAREGRTTSFALVPLLRDRERLLPLEPLRTAEGWIWSAEGLLDDDRADVVTIKTTTNKLARADGLTALRLPDQADLVPMPSRIYRYMLGHLVRLAKGWVNERRPFPPALLHRLERRSSPGLADLNSRIRHTPEATASELAAFLQTADGIGLSLQGPPGTGKTTVTAAAIAALVISGQRVAVSSNSNDAINTVLRKVQDHLEAAGDAATVVKASSSTGYQADRRALAGSGVQALQEKQLPDRPAVLGSTVFTLVKDTWDNTPFDLLVIDEAGQVPLSNLLYMSRVARNILLVGDQQQLSQPSRAEHPGDSGLSCLDYVMQGEPVVPPDRGVFLATSWRMPPPLTAVVSQLFYAGQLQPAAANTANEVVWNGPSQGLLFEPVAHSGNSTASEEEVERIAALLEQLEGRTYRRARLLKGELHIEQGQLSRHDILITAPHNLQVNRLRRRLGDQVRIGTVDRFQGQEAPVAIHSLTASDGDSAPRGIDFLLDPNRLNVAISRAQCLSIVVGSPELASGVSNSIANVQRLNRLCAVMAAAP
jgi:predicted RecB family nuclease